MRKKISEMTKQDKAAFLKATIRATEKEQGVPWPWMEKYNVPVTMKRQ